MWAWVCIILLLLRAVIEVCRDARERRRFDQVKFETDLPFSCHRRRPSPDDEERHIYVMQQQKDLPSVIQQTTGLLPDLTEIVARFAVSRRRLRYWKFSGGFDFCLSQIPSGERLRIRISNGWIALRHDTIHVWKRTASADEGGYRRCPVQLSPSQWQSDDRFAYGMGETITVERLSSTIRIAGEIESIELPVSPNDTCHHMSFHTFAMGSDLEDLPSTVLRPHVHIGDEWSAPRATQIPRSRSRSVSGSGDSDGAASSGAFEWQFDLEPELEQI